MGRGPAVHEQGEVSGGRFGHRGDAFHNHRIVLGVSTQNPILRQQHRGGLRVGIRKRGDQHIERPPGRVEISDLPGQSVQLHQHVQRSGRDVQLHPRLDRGIRPPRGLRVQPFDLRGIGEGEERARDLLLRQHRVRPPVRVVPAQRKIALLPRSQMGDQRELQDLEVIRHLVAIRRRLPDQPRADPPASEPMSLPIVPFRYPLDPVPRVVRRILQRRDGRTIALIQMPQPRQKDTVVLRTMMRLALRRVSMHLVRLRPFEIGIPQPAHKLEHTRISGQKVISAPRPGERPLIVTTHPWDPSLSPDALRDPRSQLLSEFHLIRSPLRSLVRHVRLLASCVKVSSMAYGVERMAYGVWRMA